MKTNISKRFLIQNLSLKNKILKKKINKNLLIKSLNGYSNIEKSLKNQTFILKSRFFKKNQKISSNILKRLLKKKTFWIFHNRNKKNVLLKTLLLNSCINSETKFYTRSEAHV